MNKDTILVHQRLVDDIRSHPDSDINRYECIFFTGTTDELESLRPPFENQFHYSSDNELRDFVFFHKKIKKTPPVLILNHSVNKEEILKYPIQGLDEIYLISGVDQDTLNNSNDKSLNESNDKSPEISDAAYHAKRTAKLFIELIQNTPFTKSDTEIYSNNQARNDIVKELKKITILKKSDNIEDFQKIEIPSFGLDPENQEIKTAEKSIFQKRGNNYSISEIFSYINNTPVESTYRIYYLEKNNSEEPWKEAPIKYSSFSPIKLSSNR